MRPSTPPFAYSFFLIITFSVLISALVGAPRTSLAATPKGAVKLPSIYLFKNGSFYCGYIKGSWLAGRKLTGNYFYSRLAERKNVLASAKKASGAKKKSLNKKAKSLLTKHTSESPLCLSAAYTPTPVATTAPTATPAGGSPTPTATPTVSLVSIDSNTYYTEHALFLIPSSGQVDWNSASSWDSLYSTSNINSYVNSLKSAFPGDYFFVVVAASNLQPDRVPNVLTYRHIADGIGQDGITGTNVPNICRYHSSGTPTLGFFGVLDHEIGHNWGVFIGSQVGEGHWVQHSTGTGQVASSYSDDGFTTIKRLSGTPGSGFTWTSLDNNTRQETETFSDQDLYLMGLSDQFPTLHVLRDPVYNSNGTMSYSSVDSYDQAWVVAGNGARNPSYQTSEKSFKLGVVYVARDLAEITSVYPTIERSIKQFIYDESVDTTNFRFQVPFIVATKNRGSVYARLANLDGNQPPTISISGSSHIATTSASVAVTVVVSDPDGGSPTVSCVPSSASCLVSGSTVTVSGLSTGANFFTLKAQDSGGKKNFTHFVVDKS